MSSDAYKALRRQDITFEDKDQALRDDVRMLGTLVGELIREQGGDELFEFVENARLRSIRRRERNEIEGEELAVVLLGDAEDARAIPTARKFSSLLMPDNMCMIQKLLNRFSTFQGV